MNLVLWILMTSISVISLLSCRSSVDSDELRLNDFLRHGSAEQRTMISAYPIDAQLDLYTAAMLQEPPHMGLADVVAKNGRQLVPMVLTRLSSDMSDIKKCNLVYLLTRVVALGYYDVGSDLQAVSELRTQIAAVKDQFWKERCDAYLNEIVSTSSTSDRLIRFIGTLMPEAPTQPASAVLTSSPPSRMCSAGRPSSSSQRGPSSAPFSIAIVVAVPAIRH